MSVKLQLTCKECGEELEGEVNEDVYEVECNECGNIIELEDVQE